MIVPVDEQFMKIYKTTRLPTGSFLRRRKECSPVLLLLYNIIAPGYEQSINYGFSGGLFRADMRDRMGNSMAEKTTRLHTGSFFRGRRDQNWSRLSAAC
jgi:hypothetical protein